MNKILLVVLLGFMLCMSTAFRVRQEGEEAPPESICGADEPTMAAYNQAIQDAEQQAEGMEFEDDQAREDFLKDTIAEAISGFELEDEAATCHLIHATSEYDDEACETAEWNIEEAVANGIDAETAGGFIDQYVPEVWPEFQGWEEDCEFSLEDFQTGNATES